MNTFYIRTEDIKPETIAKYFIEMKQDRQIIDALKSPTPNILVGGRGVGKSFLFRIAEQELLKSFEIEKVLPVYVTFRKSTLIHANNENRFMHWMISRICSDTIRQMRKKGLLNTTISSLKYLTGEDGNISETKVEKLNELFEKSWKNPDRCIDTSSLPSIDTFVESIEDACSDLGISRIVLFIDEAAHIFLAEQQRHFFTLFRDLRSPYITVNAAVYPGVTIYGDTFQPTHDATIINFSRNINDPDYIKKMKQLVLKQADSKLSSVLSSRGDMFSTLAYASGGNPRHLLKTIQSAGNLNAQAVNNTIREYYRNDIWSEHSILADKYEGLRPLIDWGRNFIEDVVLQELKRKNDLALRSNDKTTTYFWVHRNSPQLVQDALRILEYTGIITENSKGIKATKSMIGSRYCINLGCLFALEPTATNTALQIADNLSVSKMNEYGMNSKSYADLPNIDLSILDDSAKRLANLLSKSIDFLDITPWQKDKLREVGVTTIGQALSATDDKLMQAYYVAETRARQMKNSAVAAVYEYLAG